MVSKNNLISVVSGRLAYHKRTQIVRQMVYENCHYCAKKLSTIESHKHIFNRFYVNLVVSPTFPTRSALTNNDMINNGSGSDCIFVSFYYNTLHTERDVLLDYIITVERQRPLFISQRLFTLRWS